MSTLKREPVTADIRDYLRTELVRRCKANPRYSLRAFANLLKMESSALSKILNGKRKVTPKTLQRIADPLALGPAEVQAFLEQLSSTNSRRKTTKPAVPHYHRIAIDQFQVISEWYHLAILELIAVDDFTPDLKWIARALGLPFAETLSAVERLQRLGLLQISPEGKWTDCAGNMTNIRSDYTATALRKMQSQILSLALNALEEVPLDLRNNTGMTMAIDRDLLPEAKKRITAFRRELCAFLQSGKKNSVYQIGIALFPLTKKLESL